MGYQLDTIALIYIDNYNAFRIRCIMLILEKLKIFHALAHININPLRLSVIQRFPYDELNWNRKFHIQNNKR